MKYKDYKDSIIKYWTNRCIELLKLKGNLSREDIEYLAERVNKLKDERLQDIIIDLIGWGDDERAEMETFCAIALEAFKLCTPYKLKEAATRVQIRYHIKNQEDENDKHK